MCTAKKLSCDQPSGLARIQAMPSRWRPCISMHVGDRVLRPAVARLELDRGAAAVLGGGVVAGLLQAEGVHAEHRVIAGHVRRPGRQRARDAVAQHARVAAEEVELVAGLQRQQVARVLDRHVLEHLRGRVPAARRRRCSMAARWPCSCAVAGSVRAAGQRFARDRQCRRARCRADAARPAAHAP